MYTGGSQGHTSVSKTPNRCSFVKNDDALANFRYRFLFWIIKPVLWRPNSQTRFSRKDGGPAFYCSHKKIARLSSNCIICNAEGNKYDKNRGKADHAHLNVRPHDCPSPSSESHSGWSIR